MKDAPVPVVLALDGTPVEAAADLERLMVDGLIGRAVVVDVVRDGRRQPVEVTPTELAA